MAKYEKKRKKPNFIFTIQPGEPTLDECIADIAKVVYLAFQKKSYKNRQISFVVSVSEVRVSLGAFSLALSALAKAFPAYSGIFTHLIFAKHSKNC